MIGNGILRWKELQEVVLDIEIAVNNQPLKYLEDNIEFPLLTPNMILHQNPNNLPELNAHHIPETDLRQQAKYLSHCKDMMWNQWTKEYVCSLQEHR